MSSAPSLPPGQQLAAPGKWPQVGEKCSLPPPDTWEVEIHGLVAAPRRWTLAELQQLPVVQRQIDLHCVTRWSKPQVPFTGILLADVLHRVGVLPNARYVSLVAHSERRHSTSLLLADALELGTLLVWEADGQPLTPEHGGPLRTITPGRYLYKSLKWLREIELLAEDRLGYWEGAAGYHNLADPWLEQRFVASAIDKRQAAALVADRDISGRELLGLDVAGHELSGLQARQAILRNANFTAARLNDACFDGANLSLSRLPRSDLRGASFRGAMLDGVDFRGADLRGCDFRDAELIAATFTDLDSVRPLAATIDHTTLISRQAERELMPEQWQYVSARCALS